MSDLTTAQQAQVRMYLGYPSLFRYKDTRLEGVISGTGVLDSDTIALIVATLGSLVALDAQLGGTSGAVGKAAINAGVKGVGRGAVELYPGGQVTDLRKIGRQLAGRLSTLVGVPFYADAFGEQGYPGDSYSAGGLGRGRGSGGGGVIPLG